MQRRDEGGGIPSTGDRERMVKREKHVLVGVVDDCKSRVFGPVSYGRYLGRSEVLSLSLSPSLSLCVCVLFIAAAGLSRCCTIVVSLPAFSTH
jgi:hypothetical protein